MALLSVLSDSQVPVFFNRGRAISSWLALILVNDTSARDVILEQVESIALRKELI